MRISTAQLFNQNTSNLLNNKSDTAQLMQQIATGKKIELASDDPVAAASVDNLNQKNSILDQFVRNINFANNRLNLSETKISLAEDLGMNFRQRVLQGVNATLGSFERSIIASDLRNQMIDLRNIANTQDESGNYIFAGFKTDTLPFIEDLNGDVIYQGDSGEKQAAVANGVVLETNLPGDTVFMNGPNSLGDYKATFDVNQQGTFYVERAEVVQPGNHTADTYTFNFVANAAGGINLQVRNGVNAIVVNSVNFTGTSSVNFSGIEVKLEGKPKAGDTFSIEHQPEVSVFESFNEAIELVGSSDINLPVGKARLHQILGNIDSGLKQLSVSRGIAGSYLQNIDNYYQRHEEEKLINEEAMSLLQDLDFASAITKFEKQQLALNAVSSVFAKVGSISLFDYL